MHCSRLANSASSPYEDVLECSLFAPVLRLKVLYLAMDRIQFICLFIDFWFADSVHVKELYIEFDCLALESTLT
ncbi:hypothetical protein RRG08_044598 [Elysia crispata]|uniref:Uncharacterized protein n=1 Tax=Elysia crispata TaxID=231223 RepID=A0AAE0YN72_9GAST|nr:hypothetical protein RRG08_044598 [Elysia crispata]